MIKKIKNKGICFLFGHKKNSAYSICMRCGTQLGMPIYENPPPPPMKKYTYGGVIPIKKDTRNHNEKVVTINNNKIELDIKDIKELSYMMRKDILILVKKFDKLNTNEE